jgi:class 3 adenylate cyclase/TolB-like protein/Flp pilus assembly protein TadD
MSPADHAQLPEVAELDRITSGEPHHLVIVTADLVGYSEIVFRDVHQSIVLLRETRSILTNCIRREGGKILQTPGDFILAAFDDFEVALKASTGAQMHLLKRNQASVADKVAHWKIGIAFGEVYTVEDDYFGNAINVASRLQALAGPGEIYFTGAPAGIGFPDGVVVHDLGLKTLKNIDQALRVHRAVVPAYDLLMQTSPSRFSTTPTLLKHLRKPVVRLEPFRDLSQTSKGQMFGEALVGEIQLILSRLSNSISVTDPGSVAPGKQDYALSGSVQAGGSHIRVVARLTSCIDGLTLWSDRFDCDLERTFDLQDQISQEIVAALQLRLTDGEHVQLSRRGTSSGKAWECYQRAHDIERRFTRHGHMKAKELYNAALTFDPDYLSALVALGFCHLDDVRLGWSRNERESIAVAETLCGRAKELAGPQADSLALAAFLSFFKGEWAAAREDMDHAVFLAPQSPEIAGYQGALFDLLGDYRSAIRAYTSALMLSAHSPAWIPSNLGLSYLALGNNAEAEHIYREVLQHHPEYLRAWIGLVVALNRQGKSAEARRSAETVLSLEPTFSAAEWARAKPFNDEGLLEAFVGDLRAVGIP